MIRESGGDRSSVTGGTRVLSDWIIVRIASNPGESFLDRMIAMVEGASRRKTPNEIALTILLAKFTLIFLLACATLLPYSLYAVRSAGHGEPVTITVLVALLVCLIPTTIGGLLSAIGIAGHGSHDPGERDRDVRPRGRSGGRCGRAAARQDRHDHARQSSGGRVPCGAAASSVDELAERRASSLRSPTKRRKAAASSCWRRKNSVLRERDGVGSQMLFVPFSAQHAHERRRYSA